MSNLMGNSGVGYHGGGGSQIPRDNRQDFPVAVPSMHYLKETDRLLDAIVRHIFEDDLKQYRGSHPDGQYFDGICSELPEYGSIQCLLRLILDNQLRHQQQTYPVPRWSTAGRLGPSRVQFDSKSCVGSFSYNHDRLGLNSQDNFSTIRANTCVYKGKWQYELMLGTKGVMQVGWATMGCQFSQEKGVGDTPDSYAYDGNRQRKWNVATYKYGAMWQCGDIISCTLDLEEGVVKFYRNGKSLGPAFSNVKTGPGVAYFPAVSLALGENLIVNFGATPFRYHQQGFSPLEESPSSDLLTAHRCVSWLISLVNLQSSLSQEHLNGGRQKACIFIVVQHIAAHLGPLLATPYVVEACLVPALAKVAEVTPETHTGPHRLGTSGLNLPKAHIFFDFLMASLESHELLKCLENMIICLLTGHKQAAENIHFCGQKYNLRLLYVLLSHTSLRKYCLGHILFDKVRFPSFLNTKSIDEDGLTEVVPSVWWSSKDGTVINGCKQEYDESCNIIHTAVQEVEEIQLSILRNLLSVDDAANYQDSSRALFLAKFRTFLKEHAPGSRVPVVGYTPLPVILCLFHRLLAMFHELWNIEAQGTEIIIPPRLFYDGSVNYFDTHRLGGLESHLMKTLKKELNKALPVTRVDTPKVISELDNATAGVSSAEDMNIMHSNEPSTSGAVLGKALVSGESAIDSDMKLVNVTPGDMDDKPDHNGGSKMRRDSLLHLLDGIILLYHIGAHKQLGKVAAQRDSMNDNITHVLEIDKKMKYCKEKGSSTSQLNELSGSREVFMNKLQEQARQQAWVIAAIHSAEKYSHLVSLMQVILSSLKAASSEGELFGFVPDFYVESLTEMCTALRLYFTVPPESALSSQSLLSSVGEFLALHFCDSRIVYADSKDSLIQALAGFVCHQTTLTALENMPEASRQQMVRNLLQPYENRAWAQNNWILVRFWKGCGFGFRYTRSPHMTNKFGPKPAHTDNPNFTQTTAPCPSPVFQRHVVKVLESSSDVATPFLNSLLNQLNWAFSEFIGMLQEIQNASNRPERVFIDSRQLRICATCFDLALALLRVLEMIVNIAPQLFTDFSRSNAELLLSRLCQLLCQVLNRVSGWSGCFGHVVGLEIPGLETIHQYPILTSVTGILVTLISHDIVQVNPKAQVATRTLLNEPSFQISSVYQLLGGQDVLKASSSMAYAGASATPSASASDRAQLLTEHCSSYLDCLPLPAHVRGANSHINNSAGIKFSLRNYPDDISNSEISQVEHVISHLEKCVESRGEPTSGDDEDSLCTICYAYPASAVFSPCAHSSCRACVTQHLMNRSDCFFCKTTIKVVTEQSTGTIVYQAQSLDKTTDHKPK
ncbi:E3 ubiquitin-protein ligase RNF123 [Procambarus clarkii]|uniref:E3 ubiquitin-protein ligase RNF123 n=1 Tax=Procambarus clarkii TaxID=6728 RepID=UPI001E672CDB|nr:E3 ubiquitin-protein ligase RNF123-like [Procambarus clarkii]XP_045599785.1 E3 ubiquitin-protein ligase RNF123-like [Procambarus clarkii]XP_045599786.1 E3 ubiquitin-protein ligase RNF123-like [Procambarus clarkii]XP_045599787.1 E3 ubiquitin-protein ligase RNF123-like [Procambarus clarkii]XP_045599788.1 E3 ubiquitin-protein ligase RNF123-like [Procambarus clarkii]XP_045599789.1 E3 ubiquitin-protein ligase RNF123-like [Procambarus clarkii]